MRSHLIFKQEVEHDYRSPTFSYLWAVGSTALEQQPHRVDLHITLLLRLMAIEGAGWQNKASVLVHAGTLALQGKLELPRWQTGEQCTEL